MNDITASTRPQTAVQIDFLYSDDCPSHERALELLHEVVQDEGVTADIQIHEVADEQDAERMRFPGSPTIRVAGVDIDESPDLAVGLSCRAYRHNGRISPLPPRENIVSALRKAV